MPKVFCPTLKKTRAAYKSLYISANPDFQKPEEASCLTNEFTANATKTALALPLLLKTFYQQIP